MRTILILLLLAGCMDAYHPTLAVAPLDQAKYENDRQICISQAKQRTQQAFSDNRLNTLAVGAIGIIALPAAMAEATPDYNKSGYEMTDECMKKLGYILAN